MTVSLILNSRPMQRSQLDTLAGLPPNFAIVYPLDGGGWEVESSKHRTMTQRWLSKNKLCYAVDLGDHRRTAKLTKTPLTCKDQAHRFEATIDVGFRVHDPVAVVRSNLPNVLSAVYPYLISRIRPHAAQFAIDEAFDAQTRINAALALPLPLPEGMTLYYCDVQIEPDAAAREFIRSRTQAGRESEMGYLNHRKEVGLTHHTEAIKDVEQNYRLQREQRERAALASVQLDFRSLALEHLAKHTDDTEKCMALLMRWEEGRHTRSLEQEQRHVEMVRYMIDKGIVRESDIRGLRHDVLGPLTGGFGGILPAAGDSPAQIAPVAAQVLPPLDQPSPNSPPPADPPWGGTRAEGAGQSTATPPDRPAGGRPAAVGLAPVYVVLDTSSAAAGCITELRDGLRSLQSLLANSPDVTSAVRLSVLTFSDTVEVRLPLTEVVYQTGVPDLQATIGCRFEPVFRRLLELVPLETERLKQQSARVTRPTVFFLTAGNPEDSDQWPTAQQQLMQHQYRPNIIACGIGAVDRRTVARIASHAEFAVAAPPDTHVGASATQFSMLLQNTVLHLGRSAVAGSSELILERPQGLSPLVHVE